MFLESTAKHPDAGGSAVIDQHHVSIQARGLKPDSVYAVWFVNMTPDKRETGAGSSPYMFRSDQWGDGNYSAPLDEVPFGKWSMIMMPFHHRLAVRMHLLMCRYCARFRRQLIMLREMSRHVDDDPSTRTAIAAFSKETKERIKKALRT